MATNAEEGSTQEVNKKGMSPHLFKLQAKGKTFIISIPNDTFEETYKEGTCGPILQKGN